MFEYTEKIREIAGKLLQEKAVDGVIGFRKGSVAMMNHPVFIRHAEQVPQLYWDGWCGVNLANYLPKRQEKIAIVAKGCDTRSIAVLMVENQIAREQLYIIGVPCRGMLDRRRVWAAGESSRDYRCARGRERVEGRRRGIFYRARA